MAIFALLVLMSFFIFHVPVTGSFGALTLGALLYVLSTSAFGLLVSTFTRTQVGAVFTGAVVSIVPTANFSGLLVPVSTLTGLARAMGLAFPGAWFQPISVGTFTKGLSYSDLWLNALVLAAFAIGYIIAAHILLQNRSGEMWAASDMAAAGQQTTPQAVTKAKGLGSDRFTKLRLHLANIYHLFINELRSIRHDPIVLAVMAYSFTIAIYAVATGATTEATNLSVGIVDEDHSDLSHRIADGLTPPTLQPPVQIAAPEIDPAMNSQRFIFVIEFPPAPEGYSRRAATYDSNRRRCHRDCPGRQREDLHPERHHQLCLGLHHRT